MPRPRFSATVARAVLAKTGGACHHCGGALDAEERRQWHIDHWPVRYADIDDQCGCCGMFLTDPSDVANLVPSCVACNTSHRNEVTRYCGHSQPRIRRSWLAWLARGALLAGASFGAGYGACAYL